MSMLRSLFILLIAGTVIASASVIPTPQSTVSRSSVFKFTSATKVVLGSNSAGEQFIAEQLNGELASLRGPQLKVSAADDVRRLSGNFVFIGRAGTEFAKRFLKERKGTLTPQMKAEGYFLDADANGIVIIAESEKGLFYGMMSLLQLLTAEKKGIAVQGITIHDYPAQKIRGITDDISRGQISTLENFKKIIRFCARYKMNVYSPYIEDVFAFKNHPLIGKDRSPLTAAECKALDSYAKQYHVELIPIFETLGHWENILIRPEYARFAEFPGAQTVNVSDEKVYAMLDEMIGEIAACFSSPYFNIAADESWDVGLGVNKERVKKSDLATVHAEHYKRIFEIVKKHGKKVMMYGDIILDQPAIMQKIPKDVVMVDWHYGANLDYSSPEIFSAAGFPYVVSPAVWNFTGPFPNYIVTFLNIEHLNRDGYTNGSLGILCSNWNDFGGEALRELNYYGYAWNAQCAWNPDSTDQTVFNALFFRDFFGSEASSDLQTVYALLSSPANQYHWYELWRHPMLPNRDDMIWEKRLALVQRMQSIRSTMPLVHQALDAAAKKGMKNEEHLQYLSFVASLNSWFASKVAAQERIRLIVKDTVRTADERGAEIAALCDGVVAELRTVRQRFESVWNTTNRKHSLELLLQRYDRQISYWNELAARVQSGDMNVDPSLQSQWIHHPQARPGVKDSLQVPKAYFRKEFSAGKGIRSAKLQLLADTYAQLWVNGTMVGSVEARRSLSLTVENQRAKIFDITSYLTDTLNVIAVEVQNFQQNASASVNIAGEIVSTDGSLRTIGTDTTWRVSDAAPAGWNSLRVAAGSWPVAAVRKYPTPIVAPNFATGRTSWYER
ncbi:MAG: family 20 glycosylhydrolase [Bacteroidetes bacterium]|nr:family 20 glycosylhydrolase [Bacteroidota bacterium]